MVAISRAHDNPDDLAAWLLYADDDPDAFGGCHTVLVVDEPATDKDDPRERCEYESWGPGGKQSGCRTRSEAELLQIDAHRRACGDRPAIRAITWGRAVPIYRPDTTRANVPLPVTPRTLDDIADDYERRLYALSGLQGSRKKAGAYYTPASLVESLLDSALQPLIDEAVDKATPVERITALMEITFCDPSCGSGAFPVAAARRIGYAVAVEDAGTLDVTDGEIRMALRATVARCAQGVELAEIAAELCKVALWLESMDPDLPLLFLDDKIRVGNALLGTTPALLDGGIPDAAFTALEGDDKKVVAELRRRNAAERQPVGAEQGSLF